MIHSPIFSMATFIWYSLIMIYYLPELSRRVCVTATA